MYRVVFFVFATLPYLASATITLGKFELKGNIPDLSQLLRFSLLFHSIYNSSLDNPQWTESHLEHLCSKFPYPCL